MKALLNSNFNKIQINSVTGKKQQIQKLNSILDKEENNVKR